jgi:hypothetical protein
LLIEWSESGLSGATIIEKIRAYGSAWLPCHVRMQRGNKNLVKISAGWASLFLIKRTNRNREAADAYDIEWFIQ